MSDFLANLAGRSLGKAEVIQPRVPSLYEPYRRDSGVASLRTPLANRSIQADAASAPRFEERELTGVIESTESIGRTQPAIPRAAPKAPVTPEHRDISGSEMARAAEASPRDQSPGVPPALVPRPITRLDVAMPSLPASTAEKTFHSAVSRPEVTPQEAVLLGSTPSGPAADQQQPGSADASEPLSHEIATRQSDPRQAAGPEANQFSVLANRQTPSIAQASRLTRQALVTRAVGSLPAPPAAENQRPVADLPSPEIRSTLPAIRPPMAPRLANPRNPEIVSPAAASSSPAIQVSIGRVEVRAVFPEPAPSAPAPRPRSTVSLDEYLNQPARGKR